MLRLILAIIVAMFVAVGVLAVGLYHFFGWKGLIAFPFLMVAFAWVAIVVIKNLVKNLALRLVGMKARALRGATLNVHSAKLVPKPAEPTPEADDEDANDEAKESPAMKAVEIPPRDYIELDTTITPKTNSDKSIWEPSELILTSSRIKSVIDLEEKEIGTAHSVEIWDGSAFGPDDPGKYPGEQRLRIIFEVTPGANSAWLYYYNEPIGQLKLPVGTINV
ncbi:MAG TPA: hypothetical protein VNU95_13135 [Candidatus Acidoferrales bacterium]|jgi:hypothetical protein|nr:hypothetical protein [Candidatus Acidoferrales bacterium]